MVVTGDMKGKESISYACGELHSLDPKPCSLWEKPTVLMNKVW